jgi:hypothetical protein
MLILSCALPGIGFLVAVVIPAVARWLGWR